MRQFLLIAGLLCTSYLPLGVTLPNVGLDPSWQLGLAYIFAKGMRFGPDIAFTYGPLGGVYVRSGWDGSFFYSTCLWLGLILVTARVVSLCLRGRSWMSILFVLSPLLLMPLTDSLIVYLAFCVCLSSSDIAPRRWLSLSIVAAFSLLSLCKFSFWIVGIVGFAPVALAISQQSGRRRRHAFWLALPLGWVVAWILLGQSLKDLPLFIVRGLQFSGGYSAAMGIDGPASELSVGVFLLGWVAVLIVAPVVSKVSKERQRSVRLLAATRGLAMLALVWVAFKHGFVRHDQHVLGFACFTASAIGTLRPLSHDPDSWGGFRATLAHRAATVASVYLLVSTSHNHLRTGADLLESSLVRLEQQFEDLSSVFEGAAVRKARFQAALREIKVQNPLPHIDGRVDIVSSEVAPVLANALEWSPRPVFQSYAAYTRELAQANRDYAADARGPLHYLVKVKSIDGHAALQEDPLLWPELLTKFEVASFKSMAHLTRRSVERSSTQRQISLGLNRQIYTLPDDDYDFATIRVRPTTGFVDAVMGPVFRPGNVYMLLELADGTARRIRYILSLQDTPFIISPLIENTADFAALAQGSPLVQQKRVVRFRFANAAGEVLSVNGEPVVTTVKLASQPHPGQFAILRGIRDVFEHPILREGSRSVVNAHAPALVAYEPERGSVKVCYGIRAGDAWTRGEFDGVRFKAFAEGATLLLLDRILTPKGDAPTAREECQQLSLPQGTKRLMLETATNGTAAYDWAYWTLQAG